MRRKDESGARIRGKERIECTRRVNTKSNNEEDKDSDYTL